MNHCSSTFRYVKYDQRAIEQQTAIKAKFEELEALISKTLIPGRATSLIATNLEVAYMWVGKSIRDEQFNRDAAYGKVTEEQVDRDPKADEPKRYFDKNGVEYLPCPEDGSCPVAPKEPETVEMTIPLVKPRALKKPKASK